MSLDRLRNEFWRGVRISATLTPGIGACHRAADLFLVAPAIPLE